MSDKKHNSKLLDVENIMKTHGGRQYMADLLQYCRTSENIFDNDPIKHAYNAGLRAVGLKIERGLKEASPALYLKMIEENLNG